MARISDSGGKGLHIRVAVPADGDTIVAGNCAMAFETEGRVLDYETAHSGAMAVIEDPAKGWYLVAESDGVIIGQLMITFEWSDWRCGHIWWVQSVYILPEYRRTGVFSQMYAWIRASAHCCPDVVGLRLYVERENEAARAAYCTLGMGEAPYVMYEDIF